MGVIKKQTIKGSIYSYLGVAVGFLTAGLLMPKILSTEQLGLVNLLAAVSAIYAQFSTLGFTKVTERLFSYFRDKDKNHNGFAFLTVIVGASGFAIALVSFFILKPYIIESNIEESPLLVDYIYLMIPLIFFRMITVMLDSYNKMLYDATTGTFLTDLLFRIGNFILIIAYFFKLINFPAFVLGYVFFLCFPAIYLAVLLIRRGHFNLRPQLDFISPAMRKEMIDLSLFGIIGGLSSIALKNVDTVLVNQYLDLSMTGIYTTCFFFGSVIIIPGIALGKISSTIIADAWKDNDLPTIEDIYYKSSINQLFFGLLIFILMISNLHNIFKILPEEYSQGKWVIILISLSNLIVTSSGVSVQIIGTSHKYRIQTYSLGVLLVLAIAFYMIFIPVWGITGAAIGSLLSVSIASLLRVFYLHQSMKLFPYRITHLKCIAFGALAWLVSEIIPIFDFFVIDLLIRSFAISIVFISFCYWFNISDDLTKIANKILLKLRLK